MTEHPAEPTYASMTSHRAARRLACRVSEFGCRYWPLHEPHEVSDGPALTMCLNCGDVVTLQAAFPSYPKP